MTKRELIARVASSTNATKTKTEKTLDAFLDVIADELKAGGEVRLTGFGKFVVRKRKGRTGCNPQTGEKIDIPSTASPCFVAGAALKNIVRS